MAIVINNNVAALNANRRLGENTAQLNRTFTRLSSGLRINRAGDDAAGLSIAAALDSDARVYNQAIRNVNDGISYVDIAEGATSELKNILTRMRELATQASNGTYGNDQRTALNAEVQSLSAEYNRIIRSAEFNGASLFTNGTDLYVQAGYGTAEQLRVALGYEATVTAGTGTFGTAAANWVSGSGSALDLTANDFDGDGDTDMVSAVMNGVSVSVVISLSNGNGSFRAGVSYSDPGGTNTQSLVSGDFNGDGRFDIVAGNYNAGSQSVFIFLGNGNGSFKGAVSYSVSGTRNRSLAVGNIDGDADLDIISVDSGGANNVKILLGNGDGTFLAGSALGSAAGTDGWDVALEDLNNDDILDIVTAERGGRRVLAYIGNGNGTFRAAISSVVTFSGAPEALDVADLNSDGKLDYIVADAGGLLAVALGNGNGTFLAVTSYGTNSNRKGVSAIDFNGDGKVDIAASDASTNKLEIYLGNGDGTFRAPTSFVTGGTTLRRVAVFDANGDTVSDIAIGANNNVYSLLGDSATTTTTIRIREVSGISVSSRANALAAQGAIDTYFTELSGVLGIIGASSSRLDTVVRTIGVRRENFLAAASRITDADVAEEAANLVKGRLLQQSAAAILANANQLPALALELLGGG